MLTQEHLKELFDYDPTTGEFTRKIGGRKSAKNIASQTGCDNGIGYLICSIDGKIYTLHRLAWLYSYGYFPEHDIDHKNGKTDDNRISNLRHKSRGCNLQNQKVNKANTSGFPGVTWDKRGNKWKAQIQLHSKMIFLGNFDTPLDAALARFTFEANHPEWTCNYRSELYLAIKRAWPMFKG